MEIHGLTKLLLKLSLKSSKSAARTWKSEVGVLCEKLRGKVEMRGHMSYLDVYVSTLFASSEYNVNFLVWLSNIFGCRLIISSSVKQYKFLWILKICVPNIRSLDELSIFNLRLISVRKA